MKVTCGSCGTRVEPAEFCPKCGAMLPQRYEEQREERGKVRSALRTRLGVFLVALGLVVVAFVVVFAVGSLG
ncbi:MAG: hypothetical protein ACYC6T_06725 [Thermoleophilia bacterium]